MKINQLKAGVILSYISMILGSIVSILYTPIMLRLLGQSEYGLYNLVNSVVSYLGILSFGMGSAYIRYYSIYKVNSEENKIAKLNGMFMTVFSIIGIVSLIVGSILVFNTEKLFNATLTINEINKAKILMTILVINIAISFPMSIFDSYIVANQEYFFQKLLQVIKTIINPFLILPVLLMGFGSVGMVLMTTVLNVSISIANVIFCRKKLKIKFNFKKIEYFLLKEIAIFSSFIFINIIVDQINWNVDKFLLGMYKGTKAVAVYGVAAQLNSYYMSFASSISYVFIPRIHQIVASNDDNELTQLFTRVGRIQFMILILILSGLIFFGNEFINLWAGNQYKSAYNIVLLLTIPVTIPLIQNLGIEIQRAKNMHKFRSILYLIIAVANIMISIPLCKIYGEVGCAIGTAISLFIGNGIIMNIYYHKKIKLNIIYFWRKISDLIPAIVVPIVFGIFFMIKVDLNSIKNILLFGCIYVLVFCTSMWFIGMNKYEKNLILKPLTTVFCIMNLRDKRKNIKNI